MSDELDDFLKQAALRRQQRQQQKAGNRPATPPASQPAPPPQTRQQPAQRPSQRQSPQRPAPPPPRSIPTLIPTAEVVEYAEPVRPSVGNLQPSLAPRHIDSTVSQSDDRLNTHLKDVFQHEISKIKTAESRAKTPSAAVSDSASVVEQIQLQNERAVSSGAIIAQLRNPQTLRLAIIAHEVMKRPWQ